MRIGLVVTCALVICWAASAWAGPEAPAAPAAVDLPVAGVALPDGPGALKCAMLGLGGSVVLLGAGLVSRRRMV